MIFQNIAAGFRKIKGFRFNFGANRNRDWRVLVALFVVLNLLNVGWGLYGFWRVYSGQVFETKDAPAIESAETINAEVLESTLEMFNQRKLRLLDAGGKKYYSDPAV
ncbi:MAG: hypothetical protein UY17_C0022G0010 [Candidatus Beckwithbacteria bacterium GW2011_GWC2_47_9]|uniref:Uncharacterized protein n=1 Tax=Candidatus Beckwithbacteria bacterium GW2011_GWC2_47_9 TaxID=1618373 RepID=A0A0G1TZP0_9BACT|nr:MAG: hypothetical protein UX94_C0011G0010 [Parcubacteria group bacterium GW2011_GWA2_47_21]KKU87296.1 MAG: hypothetical protein UY17_C0022G0010 [Candidatus Beckwithbacteria bacterium GW2011_GWC2_47_9]